IEAWEGTVHGEALTAIVALPRRASSSNAGVGASPPRGPKWSARAVSRTTSRTFGCFFAPTAGECNRLPGGVGVGVGGVGGRAGLAGPAPDYPDAIRRVYAVYAEAHGKSRFGDKTPPFLMHVRTLAELFPEARFVHLVRDGRDVALSLREQPFAPSSFAGAA